MTQRSARRSKFGQWTFLGGGQEYPKEKLELLTYVFQISELSWSRPNGNSASGIDLLRSRRTGQNPNKVPLDRFSSIPIQENTVLVYTCKCILPYSFPRVSEPVTATRLSLSRRPLKQRHLLELGYSKSATLVPYPRMQGGTDGGKACRSTTPSQMVPGENGRAPWKPGKEGKIVKRTSRRKIMLNPGHEYSRVQFHFAYPTAFATLGRLCARRDPCASTNTAPTLT